MPFGSNALRAPWSLALGMAFVATILPYGQVLFSLVRSLLVGTLVLLGLVLGTFRRLEGSTDGVSWPAVD